MVERDPNVELWKHIDYYVTIIRGFLPEKYRLEILDGVEKIDWGKRTSYAKDIEANERLMSWVDTAINKYVFNYKFPWFNEISGYTRIKYFRHDEGKNVPLHCDHVRNLFGKDAKGIPVLTTHGVLNDDYEGGDLYMYGNKKVDLKAGDLVIYPSTFIYPTEMKEVTKGVKYSYTSWAW